MQNFIDIPSTDSLQNSRLKLINNDKSIMSCHSGKAFPANNLEIGMQCLRTDLNQLFELKDLTPTWILIADLNKTYTNKEYVDEKIDNHGNHVPVKETANNKKFLRNDNTWQEVTPANIGAATATHNHNASDVGAAPASHTHVASQISGIPVIPESLPANGGNADTVGGQKIEQIIASAVASSSKVVIMTGTIAHGGTIPLPTGYIKEECKWMVSIGSFGNWGGQGKDGIDTVYCNVDSNRYVNCYTTNGPTFTGTANYIIIGVK